MKCSYKRIIILLALLVPLYVVPISVYAQQPFQTDDADTTERGTFHFEFFNEFDVLQRSFYPARTQNTSNFKLNYGLTDRIELDCDIPVITIFNADVSPLGNPMGNGDLDFGVKYNFRQEKRGSWLPALAVANYVEVPTGNVEKQLGSGVTDVELYGVAQKTLPKDFTLRANLGFLFTGNDSTGLVGITSLRGAVWTAGISLVKEINSKLSLGGEVFGGWTGNRALRESQLTPLVGVIYAVRDNFSFNFAFHGGKGEGSPRVGAVVGFSMDFK